MKILLIGLGSIGKRHLANLLVLGYTDVSVVSRSSPLPDPYGHFARFADVEEALAQQSFDCAFVCSPTAKHTADLLPLLRHQVRRIYLEKPVADRWDDIAQIRTLAAAYENRIVLGFDLHFDPGLTRVKELMQSGAIGEIVCANAQVGQYLPDWRPHEDYKTGTSARIETGGGVMLDLVHEFDYLQWLMGGVASVACQSINTGALQIQTEEVADVLLKFKGGQTGSIHLDYWQRTLVRNCLITGTAGSIVWDLAKSEVRWIASQTGEAQMQWQHFEYANFARNDRFVAIVKSFMATQWDDRLTSLEQGFESLKLVLAAKHSSKAQSFVSLAQFNVD